MTADDLHVKGDVREYEPEVNGAFTSHLYSRPKQLPAFLVSYPGHLAGVRMVPLQSHGSI